MKLHSLGRRGRAKFRATLLLSGCLLLLPAALLASEKPLSIHGSGATFPAPLISNWMYRFNRLHPSIQPDYQGIGSDGGLSDLTAGRVDFASADYLVTLQERDTMGGGIVQLPMVAAGIVLIYNLPEVDELRLSREALIGIFNGTLAQWDDPRIKAANPEASLPDQPITLVARAGASGTSYNLTSHLSAISPDIAKRLGATKTPSWERVITRHDGLLRGNGNDGVAALVRTIPGSIGYVAYPYAQFTGTPMAALENKEGVYITPNAESFAASMAAIERSPTITTLIDAPGKDAYPIIGVSFMMLRKDYEDRDKQQAIVDIMQFALSDGQEIAERMGYIPFSAAAVELVKTQMAPLEAVLAEQGP